MNEMHGVSGAGRHGPHEKGPRLAGPCWSRKGHSHAIRRREQRAKALGWFSIGLGLAEIAACKGVAELIGVRAVARTRATFRALGLREIATGAAILAQPRSARWVWGRVLGDLIDLVMLGKARKREPKRLAAAAASVVAVTVVDAWTALELSQRRHRGISIRTAVTINRPREEVYRFWRDFENLPRFMSHLESVEVQNGSSRWRARALPGKTLEWEADVIIDRPNETIAWRSRRDSELPNAGSVRFLPAPGGRGTEVRLNLDFDPPGGPLAAALTRLFGKIPEVRIEQDLRRLKQVLETGEVVLSDASIHRGPHPARPPGHFKQPERWAAS
jgi:uncharacterized membrane protein